MIKKITIDINELLDESDGEISLIPYFTKLRLREMGIPVSIDPEDVRNPDFTIEVGRLVPSFDWDTMIMEFYYYER
ncbi:hypothetical protein POP12_214 [Pectobacterium phage POP12]|nr:hypothetical protein POP12_214 [Pectobacterium phage POP12]